MIKKMCKEIEDFFKEDPRIDQKYVILQGHLDRQLKHYEEMKEKIKDENCKLQQYYINGLIEGLSIAINSAKSLKCIP